MRSGHLHWGRMFAWRRMLSVGLVALVCVAGIVQEGCGDGGQEDGRLPRTTASQLQAMLDEIEQTVASGDCDRAGERAGALTQRAKSLPAGVSADLRDALESGASRLQTLVAQQCEQPAPATEAPPTEVAPQQEQQDEQEGKQKPKKPKETKPKDEQQDGGQQDEQPSDGGEGTGGTDQGSDQGTGGVTP
jgi:hypothetical protein